MIPKRSGLLLAIVLAVLALGIAVVLRAGRDDVGATAGDGPAVLWPATDEVTVAVSDKPVPLPALSLKTLDGTPIDPASWHGKILLVNFWATWCGPCREEIPTLVALQDRYRDQIQILGLSIDTRAPDDVAAFAASYHVNYPIAIASAELQQAFGGIPAVPSTFVVNADGAIVQRHVGMLLPSPTEQEVRVLAGLSAHAHVEVVKDTGQVLLANAAYATEIPGIDLSALTPGQREEVLKRLNTEHCTCGCNLTLAQCRINDPACDISLPAAQKIVEEVKSARSGSGR